MNRKCAAVLIALSLLSGCASVMAEHEARMERGALPPDPNATLVGRDITENGITCRYSDGTVEHRQNIAEFCF